MNPGMVVKLRPSGPWRIGPDSGARNRVDAIYHSDTLYGAMTSAMAVLGSRDEWLDATARSAAPAVCFSSCFPFVDEIGFVAPPRTIWPPRSPGVTATRVRWKSARFVPLGIVQAILAGERLDDAQWIVDGQSECLLPIGRHGPFRAGVRWNAAVDRLSGASERHSTACLEFRPGAGLWTIVSFADEPARGRWSGPVKAAFRWLADSGFGGERSRGWGRSEAPEFVEGELPGMILASGGRAPRAAAGEVPSPAEEAAAASPESRAHGDEAPTTEDPHAAEELTASPATEAASADPESRSGGEEAATAEVSPLTASPTEAASPDPESRSGGEAGSIEDPDRVVDASVASAPDVSPLTASSATEAPSPSPESRSGGEAGPAEDPDRVVEASVTSAPDVSPLTASPAPEAPDPSSEFRASGEEAAPDQVSRPAEEAAIGSEPVVSEIVETPASSPEPPVAGGEARPAAFWLLSLYTPAADDTVDWDRGHYHLVTRGGRVDSSGEMKKLLPMVAEGSVLYAASPPRGSAPDVAPDGLTHPVFRAGFAVSIPLPEAGQ